MQAKRDNIQIDNLQTVSKNIILSKRLQTYAYYILLEMIFCHDQ